MTQETLTITDNRTGRAYEIPIQHGSIKANDLRQIKTSPDDFGIMSYDPGFKNTASTKSTITYIDGDVGILEYCGYPIAQLAEGATYLEIAYLLLNRELPNKAQLTQWEEEIKYHTMVHESMKQFVESFRYDAHPMGMFISADFGVER